MTNNGGKGGVCLNFGKSAELGFIFLFPANLPAFVQSNRRGGYRMKYPGKLDEFLVFHDRRILPNAGKVSKKVADEHARQEYERFAERRRKHKEAIGEAEAVKVLEDTTKRLMSKKPENET